VKSTKRAALADRDEIYDNNIGSAVVQNQEKMEVIRSME
jgi:hypothetical protein